MLVLLGNNLSEEFRQFFNRMAAAPSSDLYVIPSSIGVFNSGMLGANREAFAELHYREPKENFAGNVERISGKTVYLLDSLGGASGDNVMMTLAAASTLKKQTRASEVVGVFTYLPFGRQDRGFEDAGRICSVMGAVLPIILTTPGIGVDRIITTDMHSRAAEQHYMDLLGDKVSFLPTTALFARDLQDDNTLDPARVLICAPDGWDKPGDAGQRRARDLVTAFHGIGEIPVAHEAQMLAGLVKKRTPGTKAGTSTTKVAFEFGDVAGKTVVLVDDVGDSMGTLLDAATQLKENGASEVRAYLSFQGGNETTLEKVLNHRTQDDPTIDRLTLTDAIPGINEHFAILRAKRHDDKRPRYPDLDKRITVLTTAPMFYEQMAKDAARHSRMGFL